MFDDQKKNNGWCDNLSEKITDAVLTGSIVDEITAMDGFLGPLNRVVPPGPGQEAHYVCHACGERFTRTIPFVQICPRCGSLRVGRDWAVVH